MYIQEIFTIHETPICVPPGTICLTFDDGPGKDTLQIATLLADLGMRATFFVVGKHVRDNLATVRAVSEMGHTIGNHTYSHPLWCNFVVTGNNVINELLATDLLIADMTGDGPFLFRPPYGAWSQNIVDSLNSDIRLHKYTGPVTWDEALNLADYDIGGEREGEVWTLEKCRQAYLDAIEKRGSGVVLMHDSSADQGTLGAKLRKNNRTLELIQWLAPKLKDHFEFKSLAEILGEPVAN